MTTEISTPEQYFFSRSKMRSQPNFKKMLSAAIDMEVLKEENRSQRGNVYKNTKSGYREDLGMTVRSNWEANIARIYNAYKIEFEFEPKVFTFPIKRRNKRIHSRFLFTQKG
jgi:hypothetical protein